MVSSAYDLRITCSSPLRGHAGSPSQPTRSTIRLVTRLSHRCPQAAGSVRTPVGNANRRARLAVTQAWPPVPQDDEVYRRHIRPYACHPRRGALCKWMRTDDLREAADLMKPTR